MTLVRLRQVRLENLIEGENEVEVIADNSKEPNSRWYTGSSIYRDIRLVYGGPAHILPDGVRISTVSIDPAVIRMRTEATCGEALVEIQDGLLIFIFICTLWFSHKNCRAPFHQMNGIHAGRMNGTLVPECHTPARRCNGIQNH